jgi:hypothetical protein
MDMHSKYSKKDHEEWKERDETTTFQLQCLSISICQQLMLDLMQIVVIVSTTSVFFKGSSAEKGPAAI